MVFELRSQAIDSQTNLLLVQKNFQDFIRSLDFNNQIGRGATTDSKNVAYTLFLLTP